MYTYADSRCCTTETNNIVKQLFLQFEKIFN